MAELLVEIGFEEMPAAWLNGLADDLAVKFTEAATREHLAVSGARTCHTPRRLVLRADLATRQPDREEPVWGPALKVAKDAAGMWTKAAEGFARKNGVQIGQLGEGVKDPAKPGELYLTFVKREAGRAATDVLPGVLMGVLRALTFPKRMSWDAWLDDGRGSFPFGRPIRWLIVLLDGRVIPLAIHADAGGAKGAVIVESGGCTRGHRFLPRGGGRQVTIRSFAELAKALADHFVVVDPGEREARIKEGLERANPGAAVLPDRHGLIQEWRDLVEYPTVVAGRVPSEFHALPREVLETVLVHHQKYVPLVDAAGQVARFAAVINGDDTAASDVVRGMERVVVARLRDGAFFLAEDLKRPLSDRVADLAGVTFHRGLGTYKDKSERLVTLVEAMADAGLLDATQRGQAAEAARLAKCDLTTLMVREFPELQGIVGGIYLRAQGAADAVATAVGWHYHPSGPAPSAELPQRHWRVFAAVSIADKLDTLAGHFALGHSPTGSSDPFGLRRAAQGVIRVLLDFWLPGQNEARPDLMALMEQAAASFRSTLNLDPMAVVTDLGPFLEDRLAVVLRADGAVPDEIEAVLKTPGKPPLTDVLDTRDRARALGNARRQVPEDFAALAEAFKRAKNILAQAEPARAVDPTLFEADAERALHDAVTRLKDAARGYDDTLRGLARLRAPIARFFDDVLVMAKEPRVRGNRLALLDSTLSLFYRIADISKLGGNS